MILNTENVLKMYVLAAVDRSGGNITDFHLALLVTSQHLHRLNDIAKFVECKLSLHLMI